MEKPFGSLIEFKGRSALAPVIAGMEESRSPVGDKTGSVPWKNSSNTTNARVEIKIGLFITRKILFETGFRIVTHQISKG
jgi:hypothetical protein